jgi:hypothetical protein
MLLVLVNFDNVLEPLMGVMLEVHIFWDVTLCHCVSSFLHIRGSCKMLGTACLIVQRHMPEALDGTI